MEALPSLLVFGPQGKLPSADDLDVLRQTLLGDSKLLALKHAIADLTQFWTQLVDSDSLLREVPGHHTCLSLQRWIDHGEAPYADLTGTQTHLAFALTVLSHFVQYSHYLSLQGHQSHTQLLDNVKEAGGIQGFCAGFLSAAVIAGLKDAAELGQAAASAFRFAICIGSYVDLDNTDSSQSEGYSCIAVRVDESKEQADRQLTDSIDDFPEVSFISPPCASRLRVLPIIADYSC